MNEQLKTMTDRKEKFTPGKWFDFLCDSLGCWDSWLKQEAKDE